MKYLVKVIFPYATYNVNKQYEFIAHEPYEKGNLVVADSTNGLGVAKIVEVHPDNPGEKAKRHIACKIDLTNYQRYQAIEKQRAALRKQMDARVKCLQETSLYETMAAHDSALADLLQEYRELESADA